jgi:hypothetical protein
MFQVLAEQDRVAITLALPMAKTRKSTNLEFKATKQLQQQRRQA